MKVQKAKAQQSRRAPSAGGNVFNSDPEMNIRGAPGPPRTFSNEGAGPGPSYKQDDIPLEPIHHERDAYSSRGQGYGYRGEERGYRGEEKGFRGEEKVDRDRQVDRTSQYSWEPIPRPTQNRGDGSRYNNRRY